MMIDYWPDGKIDCKDYAISNSIQIEKRGYEPKMVVKDKHVFVIFCVDNDLFVADNDRLFCLPAGCLNKEIKEL